MAEEASAAFLTNVRMFTGNTLLVRRNAQNLEFMNVYRRWARKDRRHKDDIATRIIFPSDWCDRTMMVSIQLPTPRARGELCREFGKPYLFQPMQLGESFK
ncbi:hypothetical protein K3163_06105 [Qipengyuania sp. 1NDW9]|uniref:hypothetical protein n=1 Tax=Qipengyuania xiapuensis TaxID=2867236 RepID=UPI001C86893B|nr:hypothetical protein [Qipengyuania xiapuensis]MBX7492776.1 hypothetical protein [Qipengyuania xiapuensis]